MTDVLDFAALIDAAQEAIVVGDYRKAERLLRDAAAAQEATLGPDHPSSLERCTTTRSSASARTIWLKPSRVIGGRTPLPSRRSVRAIRSSPKASKPSSLSVLRTPFRSGSRLQLPRCPGVRTNRIQRPTSSISIPQRPPRRRSRRRSLRRSGSSARSRTIRTVDASQIDLASTNTAPIDTAPVNTGQIDTDQSNTDQSNTDQSNNAPLEPPPAAFDADAFEPTPPEPAPTQPDPLEADPFEIAFFDSAPLEPPVEVAPIETLTLEEAPPFEATRFEAGPLETGQFDTPPMAATTDRYAGIDPIVPSAVPVVRVRVARRNTDTTGRAIALVVGAAVVIAAALFAVRWSRSSSPGLASDQPAITQPSPAPAAPPAIEELSARAEAPRIPPVAAAPSNAAPAQPLEAAPPPVTPAPPPRRREPWPLRRR